MFMLALASLAAASVVQDVHDPRKAPTRAQHALFTFEVRIDGPLRPVGDVDGDGITELVGQRRGGTLVQFSGGTGRVRAELGTIGVGSEPRLGSEAGPLWDVGPDLNEDGVGEIAMLAAADDGLALRILSGADGEALRAMPVAAGARAVAWFASDRVAVTTPEAATTTAFSGATGERVWSAKMPFDDRKIARLQCVGDRNGDDVDDLLLDEGQGGQHSSIWISGRDGSLYADELVDGKGPFIALGDLDGDGLGDLAEGALHGVGCSPEILIVTTSGTHPWKSALTPDFFPDAPIVRQLGDLDGDGVAEVAIGDANFHIRGPREIAEDDEPVDLGALTLTEALALESRPNSVAQESGCVVIHSGRTGEVVMAIFGEPGNHVDVGEDVFDVGDQNGDGVPDVAARTFGGLAVFGTTALTADPFDWLPGRWRSETKLDGAATVHEEVWLEPAAGRMLGTSRTYVRGADSGGSFEFLRIEREEDGFTLFAQPGGEPAVRFEATELGAGRVLFTNPDHDFPTRILYRRRGTELTALVGTDAEPEALRFAWKLQKGD